MWIAPVRYTRSRTVEKACELLDRRSKKYDKEAGYIICLAIDDLSVEEFELCLQNH